MGCNLDEFNVDSVLKDDEITKDTFNFIELGGRKVAHSQGAFGQDYVVAVLDTGVTPHQEFEGRILQGKNCIKNYGNTKTTDDNMHGTHVTGTILGTNCGSAIQSKVLPVKVLRADGSGEWSDVIAGLDYVKSCRDKGMKVKVINMSLSGGERDITDVEKKNLHEAIIRCVDAGIAVCVSSGNTSKDEKRYPACFDEVITIGAVDLDKGIAQYSTYGNHVDVCQIGTGVISAYYKPEEGYDYIQLSGTSMATPYVSGLLLLLASMYEIKYGEEITERKLYESLKMSTKDLGIKGIDKYYGAGFATLQPLNMTIKVEHDSKIAYFNGQKVELPVPVDMKDGYTRIPLRPFAEATGAETSWTPQNEIHNTQSEFRW